MKDIANKCTKKLKYNPDKMWFDYQNLFEKARNNKNPKKFNNDGLRYRNDK